MIKTYLLFFLVGAAMAGGKHGHGPGKTGKVEPKVMPAKPCEESHIKTATKLFNVNILPLLKEAQHSQREITECEYQMTLGRMETFRIKIDIEGDICSFYLEHNYSNKQRDHSLLNGSSMRTQVLGCSLTPNFQGKHPGLSEAGKTPCAEDKKAVYLQNFVDYVDLPSVTANSYKVIECTTQVKKGWITNLTLEDKQGKSVFVSLYYPPYGKTPDVITKPENLVEELTYRYEHPQHPGRVNAPETPCTPENKTKYLAEFVKYVNDPEISAEDFTVDACTNQVYKGWIINLYLKDAAGDSAFVSMYFLPYGTTPAVISEPANLVETLRGQDPQQQTVVVETEYVITYETKVDYTEFFAEHQRQREALCGGWNKQTDCSKYLADFTTFVGLKSGALASLKAQNCETQVVRGYNVRFDLVAESEEGKKLLGDLEKVRVSGFYGIDKGDTPQFSAQPEDFIEGLQARHGVFKACSDSDRKSFVASFKTLAKSRGLAAPVAFTENIKECSKSGKSLKLSLSFNRKVCELSAINGQGGLSVENTDCEIQGNLL